MSVFRFSLLSQSGQARHGIASTAHGAFSTPAFMPVGTQGTVKGVLPEQLQALGAEIILSNTYHLYLRPGTEVIERLGGLHRFMHWDGPILTDSGGFQVFSLAKLRKMTEEGVRFQSHIDGSTHLLSPEKSIQVQASLGSDILMPLDECPPGTASRQEVCRSLDLTVRWLERCIRTPRQDHQALFGIIQGGMFEDLRLQSLEKTAAFDLPGYALGGFSVGEEKATMRQVMQAIAPHLPADRPRYLMGVGIPEDILFGINLGIDLFDCVFPTRAGRNGVLFNWNGRLHIRRSQYRLDERPVDENCTCYTCRNFSLAYLRHLDKAREINASVLCTIHNLHFYQDVMKASRNAIQEGTWEQFYLRWMTHWATPREELQSCQ
ncbi:tRNA guanosine(34) transglycosylase Tgt [bacterium]|nr:tRNA guanosine(34) transglycosylase Tgt [bacterium]